MLAFLHMFLCVPALLGRFTPSSQCSQCSQAPQSSGSLMDNHHFVPHLSLKVCGGHVHMLWPDWLVILVLSAQSTLVHLVG